MITLDDLRKSLLSLEEYQKQREQLRAEVLQHKKNRTVAIGENITLIFEDELTIRYQIQEMLRIEKTFTQEGIQDELLAYYPLIPDGSNLKATMLIEYPDAQERAQQLRLLKGAERKVWIQVKGHAPVFAIADEDLDRENDEKTSSVHFLRFECGPAMIEDLRKGVALSAGITHPSYNYTLPELPSNIKNTLLKDFA